MIWLVVGGSLIAREDLRTINIRYASVAYDGFYVSW